MLNEPIDAIKREILEKIAMLTNEQCKEILHEILKRKDEIA